MQALFQLSYSPTRTRMLHENGGLGCGLVGRPDDRPDSVPACDPWRPWALRLERGDDNDRMAGNPASSGRAARVHDSAIGPSAAAPADRGSAPHGRRDGAVYGGPE